MTETMPAVPSLSAADVLRTRAKVYAQIALDKERAGEPGAPTRADFRALHYTDAELADWPAIVEAGEAELRAARARLAHQ